MHQRSQSTRAATAAVRQALQRVFHEATSISAVQRARSEGALIDTSDTQTISTEVEDKSSKNLLF
jgi:Asp/Glu/hydantoin racemase